MQPGAESERHQLVGTPMVFDRVDTIAEAVVGLSSGAYGSPASARVCIRSLPTRSPMRLARSAIQRRLPVSLPAHEDRSADQAL